MFHSIHSTAFLTSAHVFGAKQDFLMTPYEYQTQGFGETAQRIHLKLLYFIAHLTVRCSEVPREA